MKKNFAKGLTQSMYKAEYGYTNAPVHSNVSKDVLNYTYIIRQILLKNINPAASIEKSSEHTDDHILRPIALLDVAYRDLQNCKKWPMSDGEQRRYHRTMSYMHAIFTRMYKHMSDDQIYMLNEAMEKMEEKIQKDYTILKIKCSEALRSAFDNNAYREYVSTLCIILVCVDLPRKYMYEFFHARIEDLERVSKNVQLMMRYYATIDSKTTADIDLNRSEMIAMSLRAFQNKFFKVEMCA